MIQVTETLICSTADDAAVVSALLPDHVSLSRAEPGCLTFSVTPTDSPLVWTLDETFADRDAFDAHQTRTRTSVWYRVTAHLPRNFLVTEV